MTVGYASGTIPRIPLNLVLLKGIRILGFEMRGSRGTTRTRWRATNESCSRSWPRASGAPHRRHLRPVGGGSGAPPRGRRPRGREGRGRGDARLRRPRAAGVRTTLGRRGGAGPPRSCRRRRQSQIHQRRSLDAAGAGRNAVTAVMKGVRVLEVAEHTFVPAASALLSDWGADVIKIEPVERGDAMRGLASTGVVTMAGGVHALIEHSNRGKRSLALDLATPDGLDDPLQARRDGGRLPHQQAPERAQKLKIGPRTSARHNPQHHLRARHRTGRAGARRRQGLLRLAGVLGPLRRGRRCRTRPEYADDPSPPGPGFGDSIGAMTIAGGIMGALFHRERPERPPSSTSRCSASGMWAMGQSIALSLLLERCRGSLRRPTHAQNPLVRNYLTKDGRVLSFCCLQAGSTGRRCARRSASRSWRPTPLRRPCRADGEQRRGVQRSSTSRVRGAHRWPSGGSGSPTSSASGRGPGHAGGGGGPPSVANGYVQDCTTVGRHRLQAGSRPGTVRRGAAGCRRVRPSSTSTATRSSPSSARLGYHRGPQGPRSSSSARAITTTGNSQRGMAMTLFDAFRYDGKRVAGGRAARPAWAPPRPSWCKTPAPRSWSWTSPT